MADFILKNQVILLGGVDFSGRISEIALEHGAEPQDNTAFGDAARSMLPGLKMVAAEVDGFWDGTLFDPALFANIGAAAFPVSLLVDPAEGSRSFSFNAGEAEYQFFGAVGEMTPYRARAINLDGVPGLVRGTLIHNAAKTANGNGSAFQVGAVSATQRIYAALHVLAVSGGTPTLDVIVQSDTTGFPSATNRITFAQATTVGSQFLGAAGPITDDFWRVNCTIGGTTPSFLFAATLGIIDLPT